MHQLHLDAFKLHFKNQKQLKSRFFLIQTPLKHTSKKILYKNCDCKKKQQLSGPQQYCLLLSKRHRPKRQCQEVFLWQRQTQISWLLNYLFWYTTSHKKWRQLRILLHLRLNVNYNDSMVLLITTMIYGSIALTL